MNSKNFLEMGIRIEMKSSGYSTIQVGLFKGKHKVGYGAFIYLKDSDILRIDEGYVNL